MGFPIALCVVSGETLEVINMPSSFPSLLLAPPCPMHILLVSPFLLSHIQRLGRENIMKRSAKMLKKKATGAWFVLREVPLIREEWF